MPITLSTESLRRGRAGTVAAAMAAGAVFTGIAHAAPMPGTEVLDEESSCTAGFATQGIAETYYLLTSAHCISGDGSTWTDPADNPVGVVVLAENDGGDHDAAAILLPREAGVPVGDVGGRRIIGALAPDQIGLGTIMCKVGARTGETCGPITYVDNNIVEADVFSSEGDSGSPGFVVNPDGTASAVGILAGGPEGDDSKSYFVLVAPLLSQWAMRLLG